MAEMRMVWGAGPGEREGRVSANRGVGLNHLLLVLPPGVPPEQVERTIQSMLSSAETAQASPALGAPGAERRRLRYRQGSLISLPDDAVLEVKEGVVALTALHADGAEVLLGLFGPGALLPGHPADSCAIELTAHTKVEVRMHSWAEAVRQPELAEKLLLRLRQMEAWASMQSRPNMEQRVLGILGLLAEHFGRPHARGLLIDVRLTHSQLASAVGGTRATVTRLLSQLRRRGVLSVVGGPGGVRFCLRDAPGGNDGLRGLTAADIPRFTAASRLVAG